MRSIFVFCYRFRFWLGWWLCLPLVFSLIRKIYFLPCTHARVTGGVWVFACNLDIFFGKLVTCTHYGATYWDTLYSKRCRGGRVPILRTVILGGYGVFPGGLHSDCIVGFTFCQ